MPANLTARTILWIGVILTAVSVLCQAALDFVFRSAGIDVMTAMLDSWWYSLYPFVPTVLLPLGTLLIAAFFVANAVERNVILVPTPPRRRAIPAAGLFWSGVVLIVLGILVQSSYQDWLTDLTAQGRTSIALDGLNLVVVPLRMVLIPLGIALLPASVLVKKIQSVRSPELPAVPVAD